MAGELRFDPLTDTWVSIVGHRQARPNLPSTGCPFCVGGLEAPEPYDVRAFTNRWSAFEEGTAVDLQEAVGNGVHALPAVGTTEVVLYSPDHNASMSSLSVSHIRKVVDLWAERTTELYQRDDIAYVLVFENRGREVGATIDHPHGQIYAFGYVPPLPAQESAVAAERGCQLCEQNERERRDESRIVFESASWLAYVPFASAYSFGLRIVSKEHVGGFPALSDAQRDGLAECLQATLSCYDRLWSDDPNRSDVFPYLLWFHQSPKHDDGTFHLHAHTAPPQRAPGVHRYVASGELGSGTLSNPVIPEAAAVILREA